jgi:site-specific DNA-methyltransferase (adenine-specific)
VLVATNPDDLILDPFAGSGTLAIAAERHGRRWLLIESEPQYVEMARQRLAATRAGERT